MSLLAFVSGAMVTGLRLRGEETYKHRLCSSSRASTLQLVFDGNDRD